ncbi:hypothetical protein [Olivibacter sitiensis]|uniref:hypothetical protein n=1 Tax=Olivibacter sitiensis TaxID=376470 RepID=UPI0012F81C00|nr:hypothetical protein [Olivibacter sitiensis]
MEYLKEKKRDFLRRDFSQEYFPNCIDEVFTEIAPYQLRERVWHWFSIILQETAVTNEEKLEIRKTHAIICKLMDAAHELLYERDVHNRYHMDFERYVKSPFYSSQKHSKGFFNEKIQLHGGKVWWLSLEESLDCYLAFENFFYYASLPEWKRKMSHWEESAITGVSAVEYMDDERIASICEHLFKLIEACCIFHKWCFESFVNTPLMGYGEDGFNPAYSDGDAIFAPFNYLNELMREENASTLKNKLANLYGLTKNEDNQLSADEIAGLVEFHDHFQALIEVAYLISRCVYWPIDWFDREKRPYAYVPIMENEGYEINDPYLSLEECINPFSVLSKVFDFGEFEYHSYSLRRHLKSAIGLIKSFEDIEYIENWNRLIESLYLINVKVYFGLLKD